MTVAVERTAGLERWRLFNGEDSVEVVPARGGLITSFKVGGVEQLYLDEQTLLDPTKNVRGGIPLLFPYAGKAPAGAAWPQHGFARRLPWAIRSLSEAGVSALELELRDTAETRAGFPFAFSLTTVIALAPRKLSLSWRIHNRGAQPMPLHFGIHPYFRVADKAAAFVEGARGAAFDNRTGREVVVQQLNLADGEQDLHFSPFASQEAKLHRGSEPTLALEWSEHFQTLVVWTLPDLPYVCVEPWTARGAMPSSRFVSPGDSEVLAVDIKCAP